MYMCVCVCVYVCLKHGYMSVYKICACMYVGYLRVEMSVFVGVCGNMGYV